MHPCRIVVGLGLLLAAVFWQTSEDKVAMAQVSYAGKVNAPEFPAGLDWLNSDGPLSLRDLRGKVVVLDFWTYACINCMHVIPEFKRLEAKYADELVVIGVHSAKFTTERMTENIREAIVRYEIEHPVVNDRDFEIWRAYRVSAWPSFIIIDPDGKIVGRHSGEGIYELFDRVIGSMIKEFDAKGKVDRTPLKLVLEREGAPRSLFSFPGKVTIDERGSRLYISDSNHNRIVVLSLADDSVVDIIGEGSEGLKDGGYEEAQFNKPQGLAVDGDVLYVADTENHAIRRVDLKAREVTTVAGSGDPTPQETQVRSLFLLSVPPLTKFTAQVLIIQRYEKYTIQVHLHLRSNSNIRHPPSGDAQLLCHCRDFIAEPNLFLTPCSIGPILSDRFSPPQRLSKRILPVSGIISEKSSRRFRVSTLPSTTVCIKPRFE